MLVTTTNGFEGRRVEQYLGVAVGEVVLGMNVFRDFFAGLRDFFGGRADSYERAIEKGRQDALADLMEKAQKAGADGVIGMHFDYEVLGRKGSMVAITAYGTAVKLAAM